MAKTEPAALDERAPAEAPKAETKGDATVPTKEQGQTLIYDAHKAEWVSPGPDDAARVARHEADMHPPKVSPEPPPQEPIIKPGPPEPAAGA